MSNNTTKGVKKSAFTASASIPSGAYFDYTYNSLNYKVLDSDLIAALGATGTIVQVGPVAGSPVLDASGSINRIRNITGSGGLTVAVNPSNGLTLTTKTISAGTGITLTESGTNIVISLT